MSAYAGAYEQPLQQLQQQGVTPTAATAPLRKRSRDIHGVDRFREVVYGEKGIARLHAMATRNAVLMYPPEGVAEARAQALQQQREQQHDDNDGDGGHVADENVDEHGHRGDNSVSSSNTPQQQNTRAASTSALATYHHKQLDALLRMVYEFNHATFVKLTMQDTLRLLARCGREAVAHLSEQEMHLRLAHDTRLRELCAQHDEATAHGARAAHDAAARVHDELDRVIATSRGDAANGDEEEVDVRDNAQ